MLKHRTFRSIIFCANWAVVLSLNLICISSVSFLSLRSLSTNIIFKLLFGFFLILKINYFIKDYFLVDFGSFLIEFFYFFLNLFAIGPSRKHLLKTLVIKVFLNKSNFTLRLMKRIV